MNFIQQHSSEAICRGLGVGQCALCKASLSALIEEMPCPHWFLIQGARGFRVDKLAQVFRVYDIRSVIAYLRIAAEFDAARHVVTPPYSETGQPPQRQVSIHRRDRAWVFDYLLQDENDTATLNAITLAIYFRGKLVSKDLIEIGMEDSEPRWTNLISRKERTNSQN